MGSVRSQPDAVSFLLWYLLIDKILLQLLPVAFSVNGQIIARLPMPYFDSVFYYTIIKPFRVEIFMKSLFSVAFVKDTENRLCRVFRSFATFSHKTGSFITTYRRNLVRQADPPPHLSLKKPGQHLHMDRLYVLPATGRPANRFMEHVILQSAVKRRIYIF